MASVWYDRESELVRNFLLSGFKLFPSMSVVATEVRGIDGIADMVFARPKSVRGFMQALPAATERCELDSCKFHWEPDHTKRRPETRLDDVVAIEAKLSDWTKGLYQASRYRQFANRTYLLLDENGLRRALKSRAAFERAQVGLIGRHGNGFKIYVSSPRIEPFRQIDAKALWASMMPAQQRSEGLFFKPLRPLSKMRECARWRDYIASPFLGCT
jgi:hypothetical protein